MENAQTETQNTQNENTQDNSAKIAELEAKLAEATKRAETAEADRDKQKKQKDDYAKECADYKKQKQAQMTDDEKKAQELKEITDSNSQLKAEVAQLKLERECLANNFSKEETEILVKCNLSFEAVKPIAELIQKKTEEAVKSAKAEFTKNSTQNLVGKGTATENGKSDFQLHQESRKADNTIVNL